MLRIMLMTSLIIDQGAGQEGLVYAVVGLNNRQR